MPIEHINKTDTLNEGREKLNNAITAFNETVVEGDSSVEAAQARVDEKGESHPTLKARIDDGMNSVNQQLAQSAENVTTLGVSDSGDVTDEVQSIMNNDSKFNLLFPYSTEGFIINEVIIPYQKILDGRLTKVYTDKTDKRVFRFDNGTEYIYDPIVKKFEFTQ